MPWARILLLFEAFGTVFQGQLSRCFRSASRRAHLAIVEVFLAMSEGLEAIFFLSYLVGSVGDVSRVFLAYVLHALATNPAAVRGFRNRFPKPNFEMMSARFQTSVSGYSRIVSCDVGRPGGYLFSFLFFLFSGFLMDFYSKNKTLMLPKFIQICLNLTCSSVKQGSCLQSCSSWASFPLRCLLIGSAPRFRPFFFVTSSSPFVQWEFRSFGWEFRSFHPASCVLS